MSDELNRRDGNWLDPLGCCRVCDGEIPHGHTPNCDYYKLEQRLAEAERRAPAESEPVATDVLYEYYLQAVDDARRSYTSYKASVRGQQLSPLDDPQYHLFVEAYRLFHTPASPAQPPNVQAQIDAALGSVAKENAELKDELELSRAENARLTKENK